MNGVDFARYTGAVLAIPLLVILLIGVRLAWQHRTPRRKGLRDRFTEANASQPRGENP